MAFSIYDALKLTFAYGYDAVDNRTFSTESGYPATFVFDLSGQITTMIQQGILSTYTFDSNGNNTVLNQGGTLTTMAYDSENRLKNISIQSSNSIATTYVYDGDGNKKVSLETTSGLTTLIWDGSDYVQGRLSSNTNASMFESHTFPTQVTAGSVTSVSITFRNTGTSTWTLADGYSVGSQAPQDNTTWNVSSRLFLAAGVSVAPGQLGTFTFNLSAPVAPGTYAIQYRTVRQNFEWFGAQTPIMWITVV